MSLIRSVFTTKSNGVPKEYTKFMEYMITTPINRGELNKIGIRPAILNEHQESSSTLLTTVTPTNMAIQVFKCSVDNINTIMLNLESSGAETVIDDIEELNNTDLQTAWVLGGAAVNLATLETTIVSTSNSSVKSMALMLDSLDTWTFTKSVGSWDMTGSTIEFDLYQTKESAKAELTLGISDGVNSSAIVLGVSKANKNVWQHFSVPVSAMTGTANVTAITGVFYTVTLTNGGELAYIDNVRFRPSPGNFELELWDMGVTLPVSSVTKLSDGTQYTTLGDLGIGGSITASKVISLEGGKRLYHIHEFIAGVAKEEAVNNTLVVDNYYALVIKWVDTNLSIYGSSGGNNFYVSGFAATAPDTLTAMTAVGTNKDYMFAIMSTQEVYITEVEIKTYDSTGVSSVPSFDTQVTFFMEDASEHISALVTTEHGIGSEHDESLGLKPECLVDGGKVEAYYNASVNDSVANAIVEIKYLYVPPVTNM